MDTAVDAAEVIATYARTGEVRRVVTDMQMPIMDEPSTIQALRRMNPSVTVAATSGLLSTRRAAPASLDVAGFLPPPYSAEVLLERVHAARRHGRTLAHARTKDKDPISASPRRDGQS